MIVRYAYLVAIAATLGCATTAGTGGTGSARRNSNVITEQEISSINVSSAWDLVAQLRPKFLRSHGRTTMMGNPNDYANVYVNGQEYGTIGSLRNIVASQVREIRYYSSAEGATRFGGHNGNGVIEVMLR